MNKINKGRRLDRPALEGIAAITWFLCALTLIWQSQQVEGTITIVRYLALPMLGMSIYRSWQVVSLWLFRTKISTPLPPLASVDSILNRQNASGKTFLGKGFTWQPLHARLCKDISSLENLDSINPPTIFRRIAGLFGITESEVKLEGRHYIHGVGEAEEDLHMSTILRRSHTLVLGTNGSGKTRMLESLIAQDIARDALTITEEKKLRRKARKKGLTRDHFDAKLRTHHTSVFILDPKGDPDLRDRAFSLSKRFDRPFMYFCPQDAHCSVRLNPLKDYSRTTELSNRVCSLLPSGGENEAFKQFSWTAVTNIIDGLVLAEEPITLLNLRKYVELGVDGLLAKCIEKHVSQFVDSYPDWKGWGNEGGREPVKGKTLDRDTAKRAANLGAKYLTKVKDQHPNRTIDSLLDVLQHDREHYTKLIAGLRPVLIQMTQGPMEYLLSDPEDFVDGRDDPTTFKDMINNGSICYVNLEALADSVVASALGSLFISDLTACAAQRHHDGISEPGVAIYVDEAAEMMNEPFIQALNKGRAAGFECTLASQTIADFEARMGSQAKALQVLGNINTFISMRIQDEASIDMVVNKFSDTSYEEDSSSRSATTISAIEQRGRDYSGAVMHGSQTKDLAFLNADLLQSLPPGHFFARLPDGMKYKGRVLLMGEVPNQDRFDPYRDGHRSTSSIPGESLFNGSDKALEKISLNPDSYGREDNPATHSDFFGVKPQKKNPKPTQATAR